MKNIQKINRISLKTRIIILLSICFVVCLSFYFAHDIEKWINYDYNPVLSTDVSDSELKVHFIDVGQADAIAIELPDGKHMLVDAGCSSSREPLKKYLNETFFQANEPKTFDYFVITHPHEDHIGGAVMIYENYQILRTYRPKVYAAGESRDYGDVNTYSSTIWKNTVSAMKNEGCEILCNSEDYALTSAEYTIKFLSPNRNVYENVNNYSPVMILTYDGRKIMLTGDAETLVEKDILTTYSSSLADLDVDILKLGHHGSSTSTSKDFLEATKPEYCVISVGNNNKFSHPSTSTMTKLNEFGITENNIFRTDIKGNIVFGIKDNENGMGLISTSVNYSPELPVYISYSYFAGVVVIISAVVLLLPKRAKDIEKLLKQK